MKNCSKKCLCVVCLQAWDMMVAPHHASEFCHCRGFATYRLRKSACQQAHPRLTMGLVNVKVISGSEGTSTNAKSLDMVSSSSLYDNPLYQVACKMCFPTLTARGTCCNMWPGAVCFGDCKWINEGCQLKYPGKIL